MQCQAKFLSTLSLRRATIYTHPVTVFIGISIHALLAESDVFILRKITITVDISIHALLAESDYLATWQSDYICRISIHALLAESDCRRGIWRYLATRFLSTLSLRRATFRQNYECFKWVKFLSTLSLRRATAHTAKNTSIAGHFYPRSPCGERPIIFCKLLDRLVISIHALLAESDLCPVAPFLDALRFLSTLSLRRATRKSFRGRRYPANFYPRSPCGERPRSDGP